MINVLEIIYRSLFVLILLLVFHSVIRAYQGAQKIKIFESGYLRRLRWITTLIFCILLVGIWLAVLDKSRNSTDINFLVIEAFSFLILGILGTYGVSRIRASLTHAGKFKRTFLFFGTIFLLLLIIGGHYLYFYGPVL